MGLQQNRLRKQCPWIHGFMYSEEIYVNLELENILLDEKIMSIINAK